MQYISVLTQPNNYPLTTAGVANQTTYFLGGATRVNVHGVGTTSWLNNQAWAFQVCTPRCRLTAVAGLVRSGATNTDMNIVCQIVRWNGSAYAELASYVARLPANVSTYDVVFPPFFGVDGWYQVRLIPEHAYAAEGVDIVGSETYIEVCGSNA